MHDAKATCKDPVQFFNLTLIGGFAVHEHQHPLCIHVGIIAGINGSCQHDRMSPGLRSTWIWARRVVAEAGCAVVLVLVVPSLRRRT